MRLVAVVVMLAACGDNLAGPEPGLRGGSPCPADVMRDVNDHWLEAHPDPGDNKWERAVYFIGNVAAAKALDEPRYLDYTRAWIDANDGAINDGPTTHNADNHAAGQVYLSLYAIDNDTRLMRNTKRAIDHIIAERSWSDWSWIDAQFMAAPTFAQLATLTGDVRYADSMVTLWEDARDRRHLFDETRGLWYRDGNYLYPSAKTPGGQPIFWARGNGWVIASLASVLANLPPDSPHRVAYEENLVAMSAALAAVQRDDGLWNVSLADPLDHPGPEASGTLFFTYAITWGIRTGLLDAATYTPVVERAWRGVVENAIRSDGGLGLVQGVGEAPASSQPVTLLWSSHDFGVGALLLAGSELVQLGVDLDCER